MPDVSSQRSYSLQHLITIYSNSCTGQNNIFMGLAALRLTQSDENPIETTEQKISSVGSFISSVEQEGRRKILIFKPIDMK